MNDLKAIIQQCFENMYIVARDDVKKNFKADKQAQRHLNLVRALVYLKHVAECPDLYFAPEYTDAEWGARVEKFINTDAGMIKSFQDHNANPEFKVYLRSLARGAFVSGPSASVYAKISPVLQDVELCNFCKEVENFYYKGVLTGVYCSENFVKQYAKKISKWAEIVRQQNTLRGKFMRKIVGGYERQYNW